MLIEFQFTAFNDYSTIDVKGIKKSILHLSVLITSPQDSPYPKKPAMTPLETLENHRPLQIDILVFEACKETEREKKKIGRPRIKPVSRQNKFDSGPFSALSTCTNETVVND